jgi:hypothetical protein
MTPLKPIVVTFKVIISANTMQYANGFESGTYMGLIDEN